MRGNPSAPLTLASDGEQSVYANGSETRQRHDRRDDHHAQRDLLGLGRGSSAPDAGYRRPGQVAARPVVQELTEAASPADRANGQAGRADL